MGGDGVSEGNNNVIKMRTLGKDGKEKEEKKVVKSPQEPEEEKPPSVPFFQLFRFASLKEKVMILVGVLAAIMGGCSMPFMVIMYGRLANAFVEQVI